MNGYPSIRYMLLCDDVHADADKPACTHVECLMSHIVSLDDPPYPFLREMICVFLVLAECRGRGRVQIRVSFIDDLHEQPLFGSPEHEVDFASVGPLEQITLRIVRKSVDTAAVAAGQVLYLIRSWMI